MNFYQHQAVYSRILPPVCRNTCFSVLFTFRAICRIFKITPPFTRGQIPLPLCLTGRLQAFTVIWTRKDTGAWRSYRSVAVYPGVCVAGSVCVCVFTCVNMLVCVRLLKGSLDRSLKHACRVSLVLTRGILGNLSVSVSMNRGDMFLQPHSQSQLRQHHHTGRERASNWMEHRHVYKWDGL